jgi:Fur family iron response transcriptional regulator
MEVFSQYVNKLKSSGLRPTKQRLMISKLLFGQKQTFHFTIDNLSKLIAKNLKQRISIATVYNTVKAFKRKGYLKEIPLEGNKTFFDTNISSHHHFYDEDTEKLIDINNEKILINNIPNPPSGKSIKGIEVMVRIASDNHNQK